MGIAAFFSLPSARGQQKVGGGICEKPKKAAQRKTRAVSAYDSAATHSCRLATLTDGKVVAARLAREVLGFGVVSSMWLLLTCRGPSPPERHGGQSGISRD